MIEFIAFLGGCAVTAIFWAANNPQFRQPAPRCKCGQLVNPDDSRNCPRCSRCHAECCDAQ